MKFSDRIKKEMTEGIVKAILEDAQYRVIDCGIEKVLRELSCLNSIEYGKLGYPDAMSHLPDFTVMNREQTTKQLVEVKYRSTWGKGLFEEVREQVKIFGEIVLISVNSKAEDPKNLNLPSRFIRCCGLKFDGGIYMVQQNINNTTVWTPIKQINDGSGLWWSMLRLHEKFPQLNEENNKKTLFQAVNALAGILDI
ncbi:hypothetical protein [Acidovorax sp. SUPP3334]|uniref:hypothetical protein n=1 Tax=Acidovorax sp. SUPP3334 TaxID=2920881 RepID=UPI0023DE49F3|nr:hypothetical protein [Acidovorax sp. SUPP3334]GKT21917.1 hypothetical protein AVHM3334_06505 [Acidovorax sp. SUPP3334]